MLVLKKINHSYKKKILSNISFNIKENEFVSLIGPSGCGKTTLVNIIAGYIEPSKGGVFMRGREVRKPGRDRMVINQENDLFKWMTVLENMELVSSDRKKINRLLDVCGLLKFKNYFPNKLSGGMKKRLSLARVLASGCDFIIMDEPFSSQDINTKNKLYIELLEIVKSENKTILLVTHDIKEALLLSDRIIVMGKEPTKIIREYSKSRKEFDEIIIKEHLKELGYNIS